MKQTLELTPEEEKSLLRLARQEIVAGLGLTDDRMEPPGPRTETMEIPCGAFVTLHQGGSLRGCIGHIQGTQPLADTIREMAAAAAFQDPRFPALTPEEYPDIDIEISVLTPLEKTENPEAIQPGVHGLLLRRGRQSGLLLPQVALEEDWDRETFLNHTCLKAGMAPGCWQDPQTEIYTFRALVFGEKN